MTDTIFAVSTGRARSAIAIVRVCGPATRFAVETICGKVPRERFATLRRLRHPASGQVLDEALVLFFAGPRSETGEDMAEFQVHGGRAVVAGLLDALTQVGGLRPAEPGEFAQRALRNGKMDLLDIEALADLIDADTEAQRRQAIESGGSLLRGKADSWREMLLDIQADLEAQIDFSDEGDIQDRFDSKSEQLIRTLIGEMDRALAGAERGERVREGFRVALLGPPNAGKSSLLNALAEREVAIVSDVPGTTRDRIEVSLDLGGLPVVLTDTAGLQETADKVEQEGIRRSRLSAGEADLVLWLSPVDAASRPPADVAAMGPLVVRTKVDLATDPDTGSDMVVSVVSGFGVPELLRLMERRAAVALGSGEPAVVTRARHRFALEAGRAALLRAVGPTDQDIALRAEDIRLACRSLERLLGRVDVEDVLGAVFARFCIGK